MQCLKLLSIPKLFKGLNMKFVVYQNVRDYSDIWCTVIASFDTSDDAEKFLEEQERCCPFGDVFYTIREE